MTLVSRWVETAGLLTGVVIAPAFAAISFARRARTFHPAGDLFVASVARVATTDPDLARLAERLAGEALVRLSGELSKRRREWLDVLGCAVRFSDGAPTSTATGARDQDVLFATIWRPWTMAFSPFTTNARDYLANDYYAVSPFDIEGVGRAFLRLRATAAPDVLESHAPHDRRARINRAVAHRNAVFQLELRRGSIGAWLPVATLRLERAAHLPDESLRFSPFHTGRGLVPRGFVHAMRRPTYALSQRGRRLARTTTAM